MSGGLPADPGPAPELVDAGFSIEIADAPLLHAGLNLADLAHLLVLHAGGVAPDEPVRRLLRLLLEVHAQPVEDFGYDPAFGETYNCRERYFAERLGRDAGWLHAGRPRREAVRIALRLRLRRDVLGLIEEVARFAMAAAAQTAQHTRTWMADQTYLQQAQPSTFGHYLISFADGALRDLERLEHGLAWVNRSPGGAGCVNGSALVPDRRQVADLLGFDGVITHTRDAMWQVDGLLDLVATAASLMVTLDKLAEDLEIWSSAEFDYVELAAGHTRSSVLMPQKRNPYALSIVRGETGVVIGRLAGLLAVVKSPSARSDNLIFAYGEVPRTLDLATRACRLMSGVTAGLTVNAPRMWQALESGFAQATDLAEHVMAACGLDYRTAYLIVGRAVRQAAADGLRGVDLTPERLDAAAAAEVDAPLHLDPDALAAALDPAAIVASRSLQGGAAPGVVAGLAADVEAAATAAQERAAARRAGLDAAEAALLNRAREVADGRG